MNMGLGEHLLIVMNCAINLCSVLVLFTLNVGHFHNIQPRNFVLWHVFKAYDWSFNTFFQFSNIWKQLETNNGMLIETKLDKTCEFVILIPSTSEVSLYVAINTWFVTKLSEYISRIQRQYGKLVYKIFLQMDKPVNTIIHFQICTL